MLKKYLLLFFLFLNPFLISMEQASDEVNIFFNNFIFKHKINAQLNSEHSIKFTKNNICLNRYLNSLHTINLNIENKEQIDDLLSFIKIQEIKDEFKEHLKYPGAIGYAADFSEIKKRYRAYFSFSTNSQKGIIAYEWLEGEENYNKRTYHKIDDYNDVLIGIISEDSINVFNKIKNQLSLNKVLLRSSCNKQVLYFIFKKNTSFFLVKDVLFELISILNESVDLDPIFDNVMDETLSWISIGNEEITLYYRKTPWTTCKLKDIN